MSTMKIILRSFIAILFQPILPFVFTVGLAVASVFYFYGASFTPSPKKEYVYPVIEKCEFLDILSESEQVYKVKCAS